MSSLILIEGSFRVIWKLVALQACSAKRILREHCRPNLRTNEVDDTREAWSLLTYYAYARTSLTRARDITFIFEILDQRFSFVSLFEIRVSYLYLALKRYLRILRTQNRRKTAGPPNLVHK